LSFGTHRGVTAVRRDTLAISASKYNSMSSKVSLARSHNQLAELLANIFRHDDLTCRKLLKRRRFSGVAISKASSGIDPGPRIAATSMGFGRMSDTRSV
jgi:hypothetical protein